MATATSVQTVGALLREWRKRRHLSQLDLALDAEVSPRHLSCVETGRAVPSREMVLRLARQLEVPLRERNDLLLAAGYAPAFRERPLADQAMAPARRAVDLVLAAHEPYPALAVDRHWNMVAANRAVAPFLTCMAPALVQPPINVLRVSLHPEGMAKRIANYGDWRGHVLARLRRQVDVSGDPVLVELMREVSAYPAPPGAAAGEGPRDMYDGIVVPLRLDTPGGPLTFISTTTVFGTPVDITVAELALETFLPADDVTAAALRETCRAAVDDGRVAR